jgi:hypothetical protein
VKGGSKYWYICKSEDKRKNAGISIHTFAKVKIKKKCRDKGLTVHRSGEPPVHF